MTDQFDTENPADVDAVQDPSPIRMRTLVPSAMWSLAGTIVLAAWSFFLVGYLLHTFGPEAFAPWAAGAALVGYLGLLDTGLSSTVARDAAQAVAGSVEARARVRAAGALFAGLAAIAAVIGLLGAIVIPRILGLQGQAAIDATFVAAVLVVDFTVTLTTAGWIGVLRGSHRFDLVLVVYVVHAATAALLLLPLVNELGMVGAAFALLGGRLVSRAVLAIILSRRVDWFSVVPRRVRRERIRALWTFSLPIFFLQLATQIGVGTDVLIVGAIAGATAVGLYAAGSQLVRSVALLLFPTISVLLPTLSRAAMTAGAFIREMPTLVAMAAVLGAATFGGLASEAGPVMQLWTGQQPELSIDVLITYALAYVLITPVQVMVVALVASGRHGLIGRLVLAESIVNVILSTVLCLAIGPIGVALGTLTVVVVDSGFIIPWLAARRLGLPSRTIFAAMYAGLAIGGLIVLAGQLLPVSGVIGLFIRVVVYGVATLGAMAQIWRSRFLARQAPSTQSS